MFHVWQGFFSSNLGVSIIYHKWRYPFQLAGWFISWKVPLKFHDLRVARMLGNLQFFNAIKLYFEPDIPSDVCSDVLYSIGSMVLLYMVTFTIIYHQYT